MTDQILLRPSEAAKSLGVCRAKLYTLIHAGEIPSIRLGGSIRVPLDALKVVIAEKLAAKVCATADNNR